MNKFSVIAMAVAAPGQADAVADRLTRAVDEMHTESGTEIYSAHRDTQDERTFWFFELYTDRAAMTDHARGEPLRELLADLRPLLEKSGQVHVMNPLAAKGLAV